MGRARAPTSLEMYSFAMMKEKEGGGRSDMQTTGLESNGSLEDDSRLPRSLMHGGCDLKCSATAFSRSFSLPSLPTALSLIHLFLFA